MWLVNLFKPLDVGVIGISRVNVVCSFKQTQYEYKGDYPPGTDYTSGIKVETSEEDALIVAQHMAQQNPDCEVYISKISKRVKPKKPECVVQNVSEKGILPT